MCSRAHTAPAAQVVVNEEEDPFMAVQRLRQQVADLQAELRQAASSVLRQTCKGLLDKSSTLLVPGCPDCPPSPSTLAHSCELHSLKAIQRQNADGRLAQGEDADENPSSLSAEAVATVHTAVDAFMQVTELG